MSERRGNIYFVGANLYFDYKFTKILEHFGQVVNMNSLPGYLSKILEIDYCY